MTAEVRVWIATMLAGLIAVGVSVVDLFRFKQLGTNGDELLLLGGIGLIAGKSLYDLGVQVPTSPKP